MVIDLFDTRVSRVVRKLRGDVSAAERQRIPEVETWDGLECIGWLETAAGGVPASFTRLGYTRNLLAMALSSIAESVRPEAA
jgi:hypothetical protein